MARHGSERPSQTTHPDSSSRVNSTNDVSPTELASSPLATCTASSTIKVNVDGNVACTTGSATGTFPSPSVSSISSTWDSRIPRPSPTGLRRSASMRVRGERISPHQPPPPPSAAATAALTRHQYQQHRRLNSLQHQQHHHPDYRTFPVITENGTESPRQRSLVSTHCHPSLVCHWSLVITIVYMVDGKGFESDVLHPYAMLRRILRLMQIADAC